MSKYIKLTEEIKNEARRDFDEYLDKANLLDGKLSYSKTLAAVNRKAELRFKEAAWEKMQALVRSCNKEIGWQGIAYRGDEEGEDVYIVTDIVVYPQEVTSASVEVDETPYANWLQDNVDDERFYHRNLHGHSHVDFGVTPSTADVQHHEEALSQMGENDFYIFVIYNKRGEKNIWIYDMMKNIVFETADVTVSITPDETGIQAILAEAKKMLKDKTYTPKPATPAAPPTPAAPVASPQTTPPKKEVEDGKEEPAKSERKGKRVNGPSSRKHGGWGGYDYDDPYSAFGYGRGY